LIVGVIYLVSVGTLFLHGLFIWQNAFQRVAATLMGVVILGVTYLMVRRGAFARRVVIEVRQDPAVTEKGAGTFTVTDCGRAATQARVWLGYAGGERAFQAASGPISAFPDLRYAKFQIPETKAQEMMIWLHRVTPEGQSENLTALLKVYVGKQIREFHVDGASQQFVLPLEDILKNENTVGSGETSQLEIEVQFAAHTARQK